MASSPTTRHTVRLADGRALEAVESGAPDGPTVVVHHGSPGSAFAPRALVDAASARGLHLVAASRAGYAGSSRDAGRDVAAAAADTAQLLDALGVDRFVTVGWSGGGPHALACAAQLGGRCVAALSVAGVAPYLPGEFEWSEGMAEENVDEFAMALEAGPEYDEMLATFREVLLAVELDDASTARDLFGGLVSDRDVEATTPEALRDLHENIVAGLAPGVGGWRDDDQAFLRPWGVDVAAIAVPVGIWFGDLDLMVPSRHGEWLSANVAGARSRRFPDEGHLSITLPRSAELLEGLVELAGAPW